jgi:hypothetical protein
VGVAPVEHLAEQVGEQVDVLARYALLDRGGDELGDGVRRVAKLATRRPGDLLDRLPECQQPGAGQLVGATGSLPGL